jgi:hypothetical protein
MSIQRTIGPAFRSCGTGQALMVPPAVARGFAVPLRRG